MHVGRRGMYFIKLCLTRGITRSVRKFGFLMVALTRVFIIFYRIIQCKLRLSASALTRRHIT